MKQKIGRPKKEIDLKELDELLALQCTLQECACYFDLSEDTIERRIKEEKQMTFAEYFGIKRKVGFISLRRKQFELAMSGNQTMLIWLGKNLLGQSDKQKTDLNLNKEVTIDVILEEIDK